MKNQEFAAQKMAEHLVFSPNFSNFEIFLWSSLNCNFCRDAFGQSRSMSMLNFEFLASKLYELCSLGCDEVF